MKAIYHILFLCAFCAGVFPAAAQTGGPAFSGRILGTVKDNATKKPLEYTTVSLFKAGDHTLATGIITDKTGDFILEHVAPGRYYLTVSFIGYKTFRRDSIVLGPGNMEQQLGNVWLSPSDQALGTVKIEGEKNLVTLDIDKKVYDVSKNITNTGGSANDVLGNVPSVSVDVDGNISLRGSESVVVLIDGKPSGLSGSSRKAILENIPASSIESVEIISNPSAKYDADGMSGIINIKLKKDKTQGLNGSLALSAGTRDKYNAAFSLNYRDKKFNFFTNYSYRYNNSFNNGKALNSFFGTDTSYYIDQSTFGFRKGGNHLARAGFDFYPNVKNSFSVAGSFGYNYNSSPTTNTYRYQDAARTALYTLDRIAYATQNTFNYDLSGSWKHPFTKKGRELSADLSYSGNQGPENTTYENVRYDTAGHIVGLGAARQNTYRKSAFGVMTAQVDYTEPLRKNMGLEAGVKSTIRHNDNDFVSEHFDNGLQAYVPDPLITNRFVYHEQVYAGYLTLSHAFKPKWGYKAGLRLEQTLVNSDLVTTQQKNAKSYLGFFPSAHISFKPKKNWELRLSYSRRINRPRINDLNPFTDYTDPVNLQTGNPNLNPEYINSGEFNVNYGKGKHNVSASAYYRYTQNVMTRFRTVDTATATSITTQANVGHAHSAGIELISRHELFKWWNLTANINLYYYKISSTASYGDLSNNSISGFGRVISNWRFLKGTDAQLTLGYWLPSAAPQGRAKAMWGVDLGLKRDFWKNRLSVNLGVTDIFNTRRFAIKSQGQNFALDLYRKRESRIATLTVTLRLGKQDAGQRKNRRENGGGEPDEGF